MSAREPVDVFFGVDPIIVSADPQIRRHSTRAQTIRDTLPLSDFWVCDTQNKRIGYNRIGTVPIFAPGFNFHFQTEGLGSFVFDTYGGNSENFDIQGRKAEGTFALPLALSDDSDMWEFSAAGYDGVAFSGQQAVILFEAAGAWTALSHGTRQVFKTTPQASVTQVEVLVLGDDGCVVVTGGTNSLVGAVAGEKLRVDGSARIINILLADPAAGVNLFLESTDGVGAAVSGAATGRQRYNNVAGFWQVSTQAGAYQNIATVAAGGGTLAFVQGGNSFGALANLGTNDAFDLALRRGGITRVNISATVLDLTAVGGLAFQIGGITLFEADRDLAVALLPNADASLSIGTSSRRFVNVVGNNIQVFAVLGDANPTSQLQTGSFLMGPGGGAALDTRMRRTGVAIWTFDNNGVGGATLVPATDSTGLFGTSSLRWSTVVANVFNVFGALGAANPTGQVMDMAFLSGPGGATALDTRMVRNGARVWQMDGNPLSAASQELWIRSTSGVDYSAVLRLTGEAGDTFQGGYIQYDATGNETIIGVHDAADLLRASDIEVIRISRASPGAVGIQTAPVAGQALSFGGNLRMVGDFDFTPSVTNTGEIGTDALKFNRVRATTVVTGDLELKSEDGLANWLIREDTDRVLFINRWTGKKYKAVMEEVAA